MHIKVMRFLLMKLVVEPRSKFLPWRDEAVLLAFISWHDIAVTDITVGSGDRQTRWRQAERWWLDNLVVVGAFGHRGWVALPGTCGWLACHERPHSCQPEKPS